MGDVCCVSFYIRVRVTALMEFRGTYRSDVLRSSNAKKKKGYTHNVLLLRVYIGSNDNDDVSCGGILARKKSSIDR